MPASIPAPAAPANTAALPASVRPFLEKHCFDCHGDTEQKGGLRLDTYSTDLSKPSVEATWTDVFDRISNGSMPPKKKSRPPVDQSQQVLATLKSSLNAADMSRRNAAQGRVVLRRLNRSEYENTVRDLLGVSTDLKDVLPEDTSSMGFDNVASALNVSSVLMERYLEAADLALDEALRSGPKPEEKDVKVDFAFDARDAKDYRWHTGVEVLPDKTFVFYNSGESPISCDKARVKIPGKYKLSFKVYAYRSKEPIAFRLLAGPLNYSGAKNHLIRFFDAPADEKNPRTIEWVDHLPKNGTFRVVPFELGRRELGTPEKVKAWEGPGLAVKDVEVVGPIYESWPPASYTQIYGDVDPAKGTVADAAKILKKFVPRAFRRPVEMPELQPFVDLAKAQLAAGETFEAAIRASLKAVLCSPEFLFLKETQGKLDDWSLASRLSYFLWSSQPDAQLFQLAANHTLSKPEVLRAQTDRLLNDPRANAFVVNFTGQWLSLRQIDATSPDTRLYRKFDDLVQWSMLQETQQFFATILHDDLSVSTFIDSDFSILNQPLATLYNIDGIAGTEPRKVKLPPGSHRGGLLGQGAILKVTANGTSTSPVVRGAWVMRNIVGRPPQPPPPNVPAIEPDVRGAVSIRDILAKHRTQAVCASCHATIDPPGFALESFDVIGGWRENYHTFGGGLQKDDKNMNGKPANKWAKPYTPVDASGEMPGGKAFKDFDDFKKVLMKEKDQVARCLTEKLLTYATGAGLDFADRDSVDSILKRVNERKGGLKTLVHEVVESTVFTNK